MDRATIERLRELEAKANRPPWGYGGREPLWMYAVDVRDQDFVAEFRNHAPALLDAAARCEGLRAALEKIANYKTVGEGGVDLTDGIDAAVWVGIGRGQYETMYSAAADAAEAERQNLAHIARTALAALKEPPHAQ